jgi:Dolichyl-phosphate-mannose-protein mannosyltransferase
MTRELRSQDKAAVKMQQATTSIERMRTFVCRWVTAMLSIAGAAAIAFGIWAGLGPADTEPLESPLMLSIARQLDLGPWGLYGPYGGQYPLVLIHAPLYYHLAAILAGRLHAAGLDAITAARLAGRALSFLGLLLAGWSAFRIARLDGAPARAGWWAVCLFASAPVVGAIPFTVRPDMIGVGLQTTGVWLVLRALQSGRPGAVAVAGGFAAFGLAICVKQHLVGGLVVATLLLLWAAWRGRAPRRLVFVAGLTAASVLAAVYVVEELGTGGRMSQAIFVAAAATARVHPTDWVRGAIVLANIGGGSSGLIALFALAGLSQVALRGGKGRAAVAIVGTLIAASVFFLPVAHHFRPGIVTGLSMSAAPFVCLILVIPACVLLERRTLFGTTLDGASCLLGTAEIAIVVPLCLASTGAWVNYGIQGIVFAAILTGRSLARACAEARLRTSLIALAVAALALVCFEFRDAYSTYARKRFERLKSELLLSNLTEPTSDLYFVADPGRNRLYGRTDLVFDHWLYPVFESVHGAEPRASWLRRALTDGSVRFVITTSKAPWIDGIAQPLTSLGYAARFEIGSLYVWEQVRAGRP